jgi:hypothetical protein
MRPRHETEISQVASLSVPSRAITANFMTMETDRAMASMLRWADVAYEVDLLDKGNHVPNRRTRAPPIVSTTSFRATP